MENKRILIIGGSGYIGKEIVDELKRYKNYNITILDRKSVTNKNINQNHVIHGDLLDKNFLIKNLKGYDLIVYLASVIKTINKKKYQENILSLKNTINIMKLNKIKKIIYFSTQNIYFEKAGPYTNSKKECEKILKNSKIDYLIIRPNQVYGIDKKNDIYRLFSLIKKTRICLIPGKGNYKIQPINKKDIAIIIKDLIEKFEGKTIKNVSVDISGNVTISLNEIIKLIKKEKSLNFIKINIPLKLLKIFKYLLSFDIESLEQDKLARENVIKGNSNLKEDLIEIFEI